jgi:predicted double-glycine peptidase
MKYRFDDDVSEGDLLADILKSLSEQEVNDRVQNGLSLLDLKECAERRGYQAIGVKLKPSDVFAIKEPLIVHLETPEYKHFAVLKGVRYDRALLADPNRGNVRMGVDRLWQEWSGIVLILGRPGSRLPTDYPLAIQDRDAERAELLAARRALDARH